MSEFVINEDEVDPEKRRLGAVLFTTQKALRTAYKQKEEYKKKFEQIERGVHIIWRDNDDLSKKNIDLHRRVDELRR